MWVVWCTRAYSGTEDGWSWTSWVGIGAVVRAPAPLPHSLCYFFVCLLPGPSGPVALPIAAHYSSFLSLLELGALPGRCGIRARVELELFDRRRVRPELVAAPFPLRRACAPGRVGPAGTGDLTTLRCQVGVHRSGGASLVGSSRLSGILARSVEPWGC